MIRGSLVRVPETQSVGVRNETPSIVAVRVSNEDYRISVVPGADRAFLKDQRNARSV